MSGERGRLYLVRGGGVSGQRWRGGVSGQRWRGVVSVRGGGWCV